MRRQRINFLPQELRPKLKIPPEIFALGFLCLMLLYCGGSFVRYTWVASYRKTQLKETTHASLALSNKLQALTEQNKLLDKNDKALSAIQKVLSRKNYWSEIFKELSILIPDGVWLTHFSDQKAVVPSSSAKLSLVGEADSHEVVAQFLTILEKSHHFGGVQINYVEKEENIQPSRYKFEFTVPVKVLTGGS